MLNNGVDHLTVATLMGHSSVEMLKKRYGHFDDDTLRKAVKVFDKIEGHQKAEKKAAFKRLTKPLDVARGLAFLCSEESGLMTGSIVDFDQSVLGWHSYSAYDYDELSDNLIGD